VLVAATSDQFGSNAEVPTGGERKKEKKKKEKLAFTGQLLLLPLADDTSSDVSAIRATARIHRKRGIRAAHR
jgi:hypothetical protein